MFVNDRESVKCGFPFFPYSRDGIPIMHKRNIKLKIQYDGADYNGWSIQPDAVTIQDLVQKAFKRLCGDDVRIHVSGASRTDAGVSALWQVANLKVRTVVPTENMARALTDLLPRDIVVAEAVDVHDKFSAITDATRKYYRYSIYRGAVPPVLNIRNCWHFGYDLDVAKMDAAAKLVVGKQDFKSFASSGDSRKSSVRTVFSCDVSEDDTWVYIDIEGDGFLYNMVRNIVGTLVEVGRGRWEVERMVEIIAAKDRRKAGVLAPAAGLCLMRIDY